MPERLTPSRVLWRSRRACDAFAMPSPRTALPCAAMMAMLMGVVALGALSPRGTRPAARIVELAGMLVDPQLGEVSGLAASRRHRDVLWLHDDGGNPERLFAVDADGDRLATLPTGRRHQDRLGRHRRVRARRPPLPADRRHRRQRRPASNPATARGRGARRGCENARTPAGLVDRVPLARRRARLRSGRGGCGARRGPADLEEARSRRNCSACRCGRPARRCRPPQLRRHAWPASPQPDAETARAQSRSAPGMHGQVTAADVSAGRPHAGGADLPLPAAVPRARRASRWAQAVSRRARGPSCCPGCRRPRRSAGRATAAACYVTARVIVPRRCSCIRVIRAMSRPNCAICGATRSWTA